MEDRHDLEGDAGGAEHRHPDSGVLFDDMLSANGNTVQPGRFIQPRVEVEIAFVMKASLAGEQVTREDVIAATDYVAPCLKILDTRIQRSDPKSGRTRSVFDTIADNAGVVLGDERHEVDAHDLRRVGAILRRSDEVEETGLGAGVLDDPVKSVVWLARRMARYGQQIEAG